MNWNSLSLEGKMEMSKVFDVRLHCASTAGWVSTLTESRERYARL